MRERPALPAAASYALRASRPLTSELQQQTALPVHQSPNYSRSEKCVLVLLVPIPETIVPRIRDLRRPRDVVGA